MSQITEARRTGTHGLPHLSPATAAWGVFALAVIIQLIHGIGTIEWNGDNDNMMRLVQVRDLLNGQGWFDLHQYRMGPDGGFVMHWSRLVDAPIAGLILIFDWLTGSRELAETLAVTFWPLILMGVATYFLVRAARTIAGDGAMLPAAALALATLVAIGKFSAGAIDHHNIQFTLTAATLAFLLEAPEKPWCAAWAGIASGLSIGIGMETAPFVAAAGVIMAAWLLVSGREAASAAICYGAGFALSVAAIFVATAPAASWGVPACDAISIPHLVLAGIGGMGLAAAALVAARSPSMAGRAVILALVGATAVAVLLIFYPQCLSGPYANLDPRQQVWIQNVREAQPLWAIAFDKPSVAAGIYCTPFIAAMLCLLALRNPQGRFRSAVLAAFVLFALAVAVWQLRGGAFALGLAVVPLAAWIAGQRARQAKGGGAAGAALILAYIMSVNFTWVALADTAGKILGRTVPPQAAALDSQNCNDADFKIVERFPQTTVLTIINAGTSVLLHTNQRALAGPYHRSPGTITAQEIWHAPSDKAEALVRQSHVGLVALCLDPTSQAEALKYEPSGLFARLQRNDIPAWLNLAAGTEDMPVRVYQVIGQ